MTNFPLTRVLPSVGCFLSLFVSSTVGFAAPPQNLDAKDPKVATQAAPSHGSEHNSYFESNQSGLKGRTSYLCFTNRRAFDKVFGAAAVMGGNNFLLENAFQTGIVVAVIKRGNVIWNYHVQSVIAKDRSVTVRYSAKSTATESDENGQSASSANFASPLIVSLDKKNYTTVFFVENGNFVGKVAVNTPKNSVAGIKTAPAAKATPAAKTAPEIKKAPLAKPTAAPTPTKAVRPPVGAKPAAKTVTAKKPATKTVVAKPTVVTPETGDRFFEGTYRVGAISCQVNPVKLAFEVRWAGRTKPQLFFNDSPAGDKAGQKPAYRAEESDGSARFIFDNARFETGKFISASGKVLPIRKVSKPRTATRQIFVYLVVVGDAGKVGKKFGCDDSLVAVRRTVSTVESPLMSALQELISLPPTYPGNPKLQNFWKGRDLKIETVSVRGGVARIQIAGEVLVAGVCDEPRILTQIEATARQFPSVKRVKVFIGGKSLRSAIQ